MIGRANISSRGGGLKRGVHAGAGRPCACVRAHGAETIAGMRGREKTSDECIPRPARMRREHRAGGKGEAKDERKTEDGRLDRRGGKVGNPALLASQRQERRTKTKVKRGSQSGRNAEGGALVPPCAVFCAFQAILASTCFSSALFARRLLLSRRVSFLAQRCCLLVSKKLLPPKKNIILIERGGGRRSVCTEWTISAVRRKDLTRHRLKARRSLKNREATKIVSRRSFDRSSTFDEFFRSPMIYARHTDRVETSVSDSGFCFSFCSTAKRNEGNSSVSWNRDLVKRGVCLFFFAVGFSPLRRRETASENSRVPLSFSPRFLVTTFDRSLTTREISFDRDLQPRRAQQNFNERTLPIGSCPRQFESVREKGKEPRSILRGKG